MERFSTGKSAGRGAPRVRATEDGRETIADPGLTGYWARCPWYLHGLLGEVLFALFRWILPGLCDADSAWRPLSLALADMAGGVLAVCILASAWCWQHGRRGLPSGVVQA